MLTKVGRVGARLDHMTGDLHPHGQNSPDIPMSLCTNFFHTPIPLPKGHRMAGSETSALDVAGETLLWRAMWQSGGASLSSTPLSSHFQSPHFGNIGHPFN